MIKKIVLGQIRHTLSMGGSGFFGYLVASGVDPSDVNALAAGIVALVSALWSAYEKYKQEKKNA